MPRPAIPKPGYSLLRLHNSHNPHLVAKLSPAAKTHLINSIAQDIEGCIWAVGQYIKFGVLDATNTFEFDQVINDIHREEREEMEELLVKAARKIRRFRRKLKTTKRELEKLRARMRHERRETAEEGRESRTRSESASQESISGPRETGVISSEKTRTHATSSDQHGRDSEWRGGSEADKDATQENKSTQVIFQDGIPGSSATVPSPVEVDVLRNRT